MEPRALDGQTVVEIDVVEMEERQDARVRPGARQMGREIGEMKFGRERTSHQSVVPVVEVAQHDSLAGDVHGVEQPFIDEAGLRAPFADRRAQVHVEDMQQVMAHSDVGAERAPLLSAGDAKVDVMRPLDRPPAERDVRKRGLPVTPRLAHRVAVLELLGKEARLVGAWWLTRVVDDLLERDDVRVDLLQNTEDALDSDAAVESTGLVDVVSGDSQVLVRQI